MEQSEQTILNCDGLLGGTGAPAMRDVAIGLTGERIATVGPAAELQPPRGCAGDRDGLRCMLMHDFRVQRCAARAFSDDW